MSDEEIPGTANKGQNTEPVPETEETNVPETSVHVPPRNAERGSNREFLRHLHMTTWAQRQLSNPEVGIFQAIDILENEILEEQRLAEGNQRPQQAQAQAQAQPVPTPEPPPQQQQQQQEEIAPEEVESAKPISVLFITSDNGQWEEEDGEVGDEGLQFPGPLSAYSRPGPSRGMKPRKSPTLIELYRRPDIHPTFYSFGRVVPGAFVYRDVVDEDGKVIEIDRWPIVCGPSVMPPKDTLYWILLSPKPKLPRQGSSLDHIQKGVYSWSYNNPNMIPTIPDPRINYEAMVFPDIWTYKFANRAMWAKITPEDIEARGWSKEFVDDFYISHFGGLMFRDAAEYLGLNAGWAILRSREFDVYGYNYNYDHGPGVRTIMKPHRVNIYKDWDVKWDWFYFLRRELRIIKWIYLLRHRMVLRKKNFKAIHFPLSDAMDAIFKWKRPTPKILPPGKTKIAIYQMMSVGDKNFNLTCVVEIFQLASEKNVSMMFLPEGFDFIGESKKETLELAEPLDGPVIKRYKELARQYKMWISLGGFHERSDEIRADGTPWIRNDHILLNPEGEIVANYRKMHLFNVNIPEKGIYLQEGSYVKPGDKLVLTETTPIGRIGLGICYDLRFPEFGMAYRSQGAHVLTYPSAFMPHTGKTHWEALLKARAIENQCFVIAAAQVGEHNEKRSSYGHSMIIDPWGTVLAHAEGSQTGLITAEIDLSHVERIRRDMPVITHRIPGIPSILKGPTSLDPEQSEYGATASKELEISCLPQGQFILPHDIPDTLQYFFGPIPCNYQNVFLENKHARAFVNRKCIVPGHVLISTKRVAKRLRDLTSEEASDLFLLTQKVEEIMEHIYKLESSTITLQDGKEAGQTVDHIHFHVIPRKALDFEENDTIYRELAMHDKGPNIQWRPYEEMKEESYTIRAYILKHFSDIIYNKPI